MVALGYTIMGEQSGPKQMVADPRRAEAAGFDLIAASDHYFRGSMPTVIRRTRGRFWVRSRTRLSASIS
jgi:hypothetical protein